MISKKILNIILRIIICIIITYGIYLLVNTGYFYHVNIVNTVEVKNNTEYPVDTLILVGLNKYLKYDSIRVDLFYPEKPINNEDQSVEFQSMIAKNYFIILLNKGIKEEKIKTIICHDLIHIDQIYKKELLIDSILIYKGKEVDNYTPYYKREYEQDAMYRGEKLEKYLDKILYLK